MQTKKISILESAANAVLTVGLFMPVMETVTVALLTLVVLTAIYYLIRRILDSVTAMQIIKQYIPLEEYKKTIVIRRNLLETINNLRAENQDLTKKLEAVSSKYYSTVDSYEEKLAAINERRNNNQ